MTWQTDEFKNKLKSFNEKMEARLFHGGLDVALKRLEKNKDNLKWAWIQVGKTKKLQFVDNVTMKAYKADGYTKTNMEIPRFKFLRWATSFDL